MLNERDILKNNLIEIVRNNIGNKKISNNMAKYFVKNGFSRAIATKVFVDPNKVYGLNEKNELILFTKGLYAETKDGRINPKYVFTDKELYDFEKRLSEDNIEFMPSDTNLNERQMRKITFLNDKYGNFAVKQRQYFLYLSNIKDEEDILGVDLYDFTKYDIISLMQGIVGTVQVQENILSFIRSYLNYCVEKGYTLYNVLDTIDETNENERLIIPNRDYVASKYISMEDLIRELKAIESVGSNHITSLDVLIALLIRSGISIREIIGIKFSDFNKNDNTVNVNLGENIKIVKLNDTIIEYVDKVRGTIGRFGKKSTLVSIDDHIILFDVKSTADGEVLVYDEVRALKSIRKRLSKFSTQGYRQLNEGMLINCKKIDLLEIIYNTYGKLTTDDFKNVQVLFGNRANSYTKLKTDWQLLKGDDNIEYLRKNVGKKFNK